MRFSEQKIFIFSKKALTYSYKYDIIISESEVRKTIELITNIANLISSLLALITAIIAYKLAKRE